MRHSLPLILGIALVWGVSAISAGAQDPGSAEARQLKNPVPHNEESIAAGKDLYDLNCQFCHGAKGLGDGMLAPPDTANLADGEWKHGSTDGELFAIIKKGIAPAFTMPPTEDRLSDTEIWHLVNYVRSLGPADAKR